MPQRRAFGSVRKLPSGRWQARYRGPDGKMRSAGTTFDTKGKATAYLSAMQADMDRQAWRDPKAQAIPLRAYTEQWLKARELKPRTRADYQHILDNHIYPALGGLPLKAITPTVVRDWHSDIGKKTGKTMRSHAYALLRTMLGTAVSEDILVANPCRIRGAGTTKRVKKIRPATLPELEALTKAMPERYRAMVLLAAWCALRQGELFALQRGDVDLTRGVVHVRRGVTRADGEVHVGTPKSDESLRDVNVPPHLIPVLEQHLSAHTGPKRDALLFPARHGGHMAPSTLYKVFYPAREKAGRADLRFHDLRHTGAVLAAATGATMAELMARLGHSTPQAAMRYQHAAEDRDRAIAEALSQLATGATVLPLRKPAKKAIKKGRSKPA